MYICGFFVLSNGPNKEVFWILPIFVVIFGQNVGFWPPGSPCMGLPPVMELILKIYHHALSWMYICGCFVQPNGSNWGVTSKTLIFGVIFCQNMGIIQITSLFVPFNNVIQQQIYIQDKAWWYLIKINCITVEDIPIHGDPRGSKPHILTEYDPAYWYYAKIFLVLAIRIHK